MADEREQQNEDVTRHQPLGGGVNAKILLGIGAVMIVAAIVILIIVLQMT